MTKFKAMLDLIVNEDKAGATEMFHQFIVEEARTIYKEIAQEAATCEDDDVDSEEAVDESVKPLNTEQNPKLVKEDDMGSLSDEVESDEASLGDDDELESPEPVEGELDGEEESEESGDTEQRISELEAAFAELAAEFEENSNDDVSDELAPEMDSEMTPGEEDAIDAPELGL